MDSQGLAHEAAQPPDDPEVNVKNSGENNVDKREADLKKGDMGVSTEDVTTTTDGKPNAASSVKQEDAANFDAPQVDIKAKMDVLDPNANENLAGKTNASKADIKTEPVAESGSVAAQGNPNILSRIEQENVVNFGKPKMDMETVTSAEISEACVKITCENKIDEADVKTGDVGEVPADNPAGAGGNKPKKRRFKKRKMPPPFIGPQRPIQEEDLVDIMSGMYDIICDIVLDTDEEVSPLSSSNESCNSSDPDGFLVDSSEESDAAMEEKKFPAYVNSIELIKTKLEEAKASLDRLFQTRNFVSTDVRLATLDASVRETIAFARPNLQAGLDALTALSKAPMTKLSIVKHTHLLETASQLCKYKLPQEPPTGRPLRSRGSTMENALKISNEALHVLNHIMALFGVKSIEEFRKVIVEKVEEFEEKTKRMRTDDKYLLIEDPPARGYDAFGTKICRGRMMIDSPRRSRQLSSSDEDSRTETIPKNVLKETGNTVKNRQVSQRSSVIRNKCSGKENRKPPSKASKPRRKTQTREKLSNQRLTGEILPQGGSTVSENAETLTACKNVIGPNDIANPFIDFDFENNFEAKPCKANDKWATKEFVDCEDLLLESDDSAPFSEDDNIPLSMSCSVNSKTMGDAPRFAVSLQSDSGISSGTSLLRNLRSQTISQVSEVAISDEQLLQSSDSN